MYKKIQLSKLRLTFQALVFDLDQRHMHEVFISHMSFPTTISQLEWCTTAMQPLQEGNSMLPDTRHVNLRVCGSLC